MIRIASLLRRGANDRSNGGEQVSAPLGAEATGDFAIRGCGAQFPLAGVVVWRRIGMLKEGEQVAAHLAVTFSPNPRAADFPLDVDATHGRLKEWLRRLHGVATKYAAKDLGWRRIREALGENVTPATMVLGATEQEL